MTGTIKCTAELQLHPEAAPAAPAGSYEAGVLERFDVERVGRAFIHKLLIVRDLRGAYEEFALPEIRNHSAKMGDGREAAIEYVERLIADNPGHYWPYDQWKTEIARTICDGDIYAVHSFTMRGPGQQGILAIDLWRIVDDKIVEHWSAQQEDPVDPKSGNRQY